MGHRPRRLGRLGPELTAPPRPVALRWVKIGFGFAVTAVSIAIVLTLVKPEQVVRGVEGYDWRFLPLAVASLAAGYAFRIERWAMMLRAAGANVTFGRACAPFLASIALNNVLPLRVGDVVRALVFPRSIGVARTTATSSIVAERAIDLATLLAAFAAGFALAGSTALSPQLTRAGFILAGLCALLLIGGLTLSGPIASVLERRTVAGEERGVARLLTNAGVTAAALLRGFEAMARPMMLARTTAYSALAWAGEAGLYYFILLGLGIHVSAAQTVVVMAIVTISTMIPSSPGYVGTFHLAAVSAVALIGGSPQEAGSLAVLAHLALWLSTTIAGFVAICFKPELFRAAAPSAGAPV